MIKKINIALLVTFVCLFGMKGLLDIAKNAKTKKARVVQVAAVANAKSRLAPHIYFTRWPPHFSPNFVTNRHGIGLDILREIFPNATFDASRDTTDIAEVRKILDTDPHAIVADHCKNVPEFVGYPMPKYPISLCELSIYVPRSLDWKYEGLESLDKLRLGVMSEYAHTEFIEAFAKKWAGTPGKLQFVKSRDIGATAFKALVNENKIDGFVAVWSARELSLSTEDSGTFLMYRRTPPIEVCGIYLRASKLDPGFSKQIIADYEAGYERLSKTGVLKRVAEYYLSDFDTDMKSVMGEGVIESFTDGKYK